MSLDIVTFEGEVVIPRDDKCARSLERNVRREGEGTSSREPASEYIGTAERYKPIFEGEKDGERKENVTPVRIARQRDERRLVDLVWHQSIRCELKHTNKKMRRKIGAEARRGGLYT